MKLEKHIVTDIIKHLNKVDECHVWKTHGGMYSTPGVPDVVGVYRGKFLGIEVKRPEKKNNVTKLQQAFINKLNNCGGISFVACSVDDVRGVINDK
jgi:penicillin-binding protein-related factor A (putative recombinase)